MTAPWKETTLLLILSKYKLKEIYNADKFSLFLFMQSDKSLDLRFEACLADEKKFLLLEWRQQMQRVIYKINVVIKKLKYPCCFKGVKNLADTEINKKRNAAYYWKNGYEKWIINLQKRRKK